MVKKEYVCEKGKRSSVVIEDLATEIKEGATLILGFAGIGLLIYLGVLFILKEFKKDDVNFFLDTINIKKMFRYIKKEMRGK